MSLRTVYHLNVDSAAIEGAKVALLPGDPGRVESIARTAPFERARELANKREYRTWIAYLGTTPVLITSTGIGGPSASIAIDELAQLGVRTFLRVGTTGAIQPDVPVGTVIVTTGAVRLDGASTHYAPIEYPAVAHPEVVQAAIAAATRLNVPFRAGVSASCDTFYPGQERHDSYSGYVPRRFQGATEEWRRLHVLNYEMESSTVLTLTASMGLRGGCVAGVVVNRA
ncbi:MAG: uridine phosphorylase, partial [Acidobacteria bacterium]|nr:uridine phosphorylase [Acidobacteriota bacterium]